VVIYPHAPAVFFRVRVAAGQLTHITVQQNDLDVVASLRARPSDGVLAEADEFDYGTDSLSYVSETDAVVGLEIRLVAKHSATGSLTIDVETPRAPSPRDLLRREAEILSTKVKSPPKDLSADAVIEVSRLATAAWRKVADPIGEAASLVQTAGLFYGRGALDSAKQLYLEALSLAGGKHDAANAAEAANDAGYCELLAGDTGPSKVHLDEALDIWTKSKSRYGRATALNNIGLWNWRTGSFGAATRAYSEASRLFDPSDALNRGLVSNNLGLSYLSMGLYGRAIEALSSALTLLPASERIARGRATINLGRAYLLNGDWRTAVRFYNRTVPLLQGSTVDTAHAKNNLGQAYAAGNLLPQAKKALQEARALYSGEKSRGGEASADYHLAQIESRLGNVAAARSLLNDSVSLRDAIGLREDLAESLLALARLQRDSHELGLARESAERSLALIESLRATVPGDDFRISFLSAHLPVYDFLIDLLMELHASDPAAGFDRLAFETGERSRARALLESLRESKSAIKSGADPFLLARERRAQEILNLKTQGLSRLLSFVHPAEQEFTSRKELESAQEAYASIELEIKEENPQLAILFWPQPKTVAEIQTILAPDSILLEYSLGKQRSFLWAITSDSVESFTLPKSERVETLANTVIRLAGDYRTRMRDPATEQSYRRALRAISDLLLNPVAGKLGRNRILVVPSGALQRLPFAALLVPGGGAEALPLGVRNEFTVLPSASVLAELRELHRGHRAASRSVVVLADPVYNPEDPRVPPNALATSWKNPVPRGLPLARLPFSREEALRVAGAAPPGTALTALGFDASRATLMSDDIGLYQYVHLATHYLIDEAHPEQSGLVLSLINRQGWPDNGMIRLDDLYAGLPRLSCDMVAVSACSSALGKDERGEGLINLSRAFFYAGSPRVLVSLWACDDRAAAEFMGLLYRAIFGGQHPAAALRATRHAFWDRGGRWKDPYFFAGFTLYGEYQ
jgi:CHAT domain-containing protein